MLERVRPKNDALGITGMLLYKDGNFMQALEGEEAAVGKLANTIKNDARHSGFLVLMQSPAQRRLFPNSPMGFHDLTSEPPHRNPAYAEFVDSPPTRATFTLDPNRCM